jgi:hypothetical protein
VGAGDGHYESFYVKATRPGGGKGIWLRHTVHQRPGDPPTASVWLTVFDQEAPGPRAVKATFPAAELAAPVEGYIRVGAATLAPGRAEGSVSAAGTDASWTIAFRDEGEPFHHLPYERLYRARVPRTKLLSPYPSAIFDGVLELDGERIELDRWPGMIGHNWGSEHAERWVWIQAPRLDGSDGSYLDIAAGRIRIGPITTPWVANGMLHAGGEPIRLGGLDRLRQTEIRERATSCDFVLAGKGARVRGRVSSEPRNFVAWIYADPKGPEHNTLNCSIADLELEVERDGRPPERFEVTGAAAYELGSRDTDHGIPLQPFDDG